VRRSRSSAGGQAGNADHGRERLSTTTSHARDPGSREACSARCTATR
jgi:hypothetical protein